MKRIILLVLVFIVCLAGCNRRDMNSIIQNEPSIIGVVEEVNENTVKIKNGEGEYMVSLNVENNDSYKDIMVGDEIVVYYDGNIAETYPMQIQNVYAITLRTPSGDSYVTGTLKGNIKTYYEMSNGLWMCEDYTYLYRLEISGRMPNATKDSTFVYLSNIEEISFERAYMGAGISSNTEDYFAPEEAVLVDMQ